ncbi:MAG: Osmosensitive channel His kinase sensor domain [Bryobacterales bacterium]|nr:Osmosensitive channel His kinase sensor domain [Bryobacterales bacterium]
MSVSEYHRPDPDALLQKIHAQESAAARGRLKIFFGYAPRVGKSGRMFDEGLRRLARGQDVVVGAIQRTGSEHLEAALKRIEVVPPQTPPPQAQMTPGDAEAIDVEAILRRNPQVCLVDELARSNPPGSRNAYRWQDVEQILAAGITVVGAVNLQHVFEEQDAVERITGRRTPNSVPAKFIQQADELVIVDVPAEDLVRPGERSDLSTLQLTELRELALLVAAQVVEEQLQRYMAVHGIRQSWSTQERILVCLTPRSNARAMIESAARATRRFHGQMLAVFVRQGHLGREEAALQENLEYARKLGAEVHILQGSDPASVILQFARSERVTQLYIGHTQRRRWMFCRKSPAERILQEGEGMDVRLFPQGSAA